MNLSDRPLSDSERSVLMKGLNFSVTPSKIPVDEIVAATELACNQLKEKSQAESLRNEVVKIVSKSKPPRPNISISGNIFMCARYFFCFQVYCLYRRR